MGYPYDGVDLREHPEKYRIGRSEQGVFHAEPYKDGDKSRPREDLDLEKSRAAEVYRKKWRAAAEDEEYLRLKEEHKRRNEKCFRTYTSSKT
jgi:hypothetical protein